MINTEELKKAIKKRGLKLMFVAEKIGISVGSFSAKVNNRSPFTVAEIYVMCDVLQLTDEEKQLIFP